MIITFCPISLAGILGNLGMVHHQNKATCLKFVKKLLFMVKQFWLEIKPSIYHLPIMKSQSRMSG